MNTPSPNGRIVVTFILPVLNRRDVIVRGIESCLACESDVIVPRVLVVEGGSTDGTVEWVSQTYMNDPRVVLLQQPAERPGFQRAAWYAVEFVDSPLCTYMYSDDLVSPYFVRLAEALAAAPDVSIALGYGCQASENELLRFDPIDSVERVDAERVLDAYYGRASQLDGKSLPVSPVCCIVRTSILKAWVPEAQRFAAGRPLRQHAMVKLAGGPDLMIYLYALLRGGGQVLRANQVVGQLTVTPGSITEAGNREVQLTVGYWLARVWGFQEALRAGRRDLAGRFGGYLITVWLYIAITKLRRREGSWMSELFGEIKEILSALRAGKIVSRAIVACGASLLARVRMMLTGSGG